MSAYGYELTLRRDPANVRYWLKAAVQQCPLGFPLSARKQTFVPQCPFRSIASASPRKAGPALKARFRRLLTRIGHLPCSARVSAQDEN